MSEIREHVADGIEEYDNPLPRWWVHLFIVSIVFAVVYSVLYPSLWFWGGALDWSSSRQHAREVADAKAMYEAASEAAAARIDLEQLSKDPVAVAEGQVVFSQYCAPCHGARGEGGIGLRLAGPTWKWGGDSKSMLTTIRFGRPPSVMPAWGNQMPLEKIARVGAFAYSLRYTASRDASVATPAPAPTTSPASQASPASSGVSPTP